MGNGCTPGKIGGRTFAPSYAAFRQDGRLCEGIVRLPCKEQSGGKNGGLRRKICPAEGCGPGAGICAGLPAYHAAFGTDDGAFGRREHDPARIQGNFRGRLWRN